jgi:hypothetical protein
MMTLRHGLRRALSASMTLVDAEGVVANVDLLHAQPSGDLLAFLSRAYANGEAVEDAFRDAGGTIQVRTRALGKPVEALTLDVDNAGLPVLFLVGGGEGTVLDIRFAIPHSSAS